MPIVREHRQLLKALAAALAGLVLTILAGAASYRYVEQRHLSNLDYQTTDAVSALQQRLELYRSLLRGLQALFAASTNVTEPEFQRYIAHLLNAGHYPGVHAITYAQTRAPVQTGRVNTDAPLSLNGYCNPATFNPFDTGPPGSGFELRYITPLRGNEALVGRHVNLNPGTQQRLRESGTVGGAVVGTRFSMNLSGKAAMVMHLPIFIGDSRHLQGVVSATLCLNQVLKDVTLRLKRHGMRLAIYDLGASPDTNAGRGLRLLDTGFPDARSPGGARLRYLTVGDRTWSLYFHDQSNLSWIRVWAPVVITATGLLMSLLAFVTVHGSISRKATLQLVERLRKDLHHSEHHLTKVVGALGDAIWSVELSPHYRFCFVSASVERLFDIPAADFYHDPENWMKHVHPDDQDKLSELRQAHKEPERDLQPVEYRLQRSNGEVRWMRHRAFISRDSSDSEIRMHCVVNDITEQKHAEKALKDSALKQQMILDNIPDLVWLKDAQGRFTAVNQPFGTACGQSPNALIGKTDFDIWPQELAQRYRDDDLRVMNSGERLRVEEPLVDTRRNETVIETTKTPLFDGTGRVIGTIGLAHDVTERKHNEEQLRLAATVFEQSSEGIIITDPQDRIIAVNRSFSRITGYNAEEVLGNTPRLLSSNWQDDAFYRQMWEQLAKEGYWEGEIWDRRKSGEIYAEWLRITAVCDANDTVTHYIALFSDVTERKLSEQHMERLAYHDPLTGLPNRTMLHDRIHQAITRARRNDTLLAVMFLDLDRFKEVNDKLGHYVGDRLLQHVAQQIKTCIRDEDTVSRHGGDEFVVLLSAVADGDGAAAVAGKILERLHQPIELEGHTLEARTSIGISIYPRDGSDTETLLRNADAAMYQAKARGRNTLCFFGSPG